MNKKRQKRRVVFLCIGSLFFLLISAFGSFPAFAQGVPKSRSPLCQGSSCDGEDPYLMQCAGQDVDSWYVQLTAPLVDRQGQGNYGYVQLWFSATCQTNWVRVFTTVLPNTGIFPYLFTPGSGAPDDQKPESGPVHIGMQDAYTGMLYLPTTPARGVALIYAGVTPPPNPEYEGTAQYYGDVSQY